jgi:hypothetical protein
MAFHWRRGADANPNRNLDGSWLVAVPCGGTLAPPGRRFAVVAVCLGGCTESGDTHGLREKDWVCPTKCVVVVCDRGVVTPWPPETPSP